MQTVAADVESAIACITQMARAAGIHLLHPIIRIYSVCQEQIGRRRFLAYNRLLLSACVIAYEEKTANDKIEKEKEQTEAQPDGA
jgi:hypothetical protein